MWFKFKKKKWLFRLTGDVAQLCLSKILPFGFDIQKVTHKISSNKFFINSKKRASKLFDCPSPLFSLCVYLFTDLIYFNFEKNDLAPYIPSITNNDEENLKKKIFRRNEWRKIPPPPKPNWSISQTFYSLRLILRFDYYHWCAMQSSGMNFLIAHDARWCTIITILMSV